MSSSLRNSYKSEYIIWRESLTLAVYVECDARGAAEIDVTDGFGLQLIVIIM